MTDQELMSLALQEAEKAAALGEVPVGAVVAKDGQPVALAHNLRESGKNATYHAELPHVQRGHHQQPDPAGGIWGGGPQGRVLRLPHRSFRPAL